MPRFPKARRAATNCLLTTLPYLLSVAACVALLAASPARVAAGTPCIEAVFFDLGDTLVENDGSGTFVLRPGATEVVAGLQGAGIRLGIITNVPGTWDIDDLRAILAEPEFLDEFEVVILSSEAPASKPDPAIYLFAHQALAEPRPAITSTAFVGETLLEIANREIDPTLGARSVGMVGIHLSDLPPSPFADYTVPTDGLVQVVTIVDETCSSADIGGTAPPSREPRLLAQPNPTSGGTRVSFTLSSPERIALVVFDARGRQVARLADRVFATGEHEVAWAGTRPDGEAVPNGVYYVRMDVGTDRYLTKVVRAR